MYAGYAYLLELASKRRSIPSMRPFDFVLQGRHDVAIEQPMTSWPLHGWHVEPRAAWTKSSWELASGCSFEDRGCAEKPMYYHKQGIKHLVTWVHHMFDEHATSFHRVNGSARQAPPGFCEGDPRSEGPMLWRPYSAVGGLSPALSYRAEFLHLVGWTRSARRPCQL